MPRADQRLYSALLRLGRKFDAEQVPLIGVAGSSTGPVGLSWRHGLRAAFEAPRPQDTGLAEGARTLVLLQRQLDTLLQAEEHTREALAEWAALARRFAASQHPSLASSSSSSSNRDSRHGECSPSSAIPAPSSPAPPGPHFAAAAAVEEGLALLSRQSQALSDPLLLDEQEPEGDASSSAGSQRGGSGDTPAVSLADLAAEVRRHRPDLFPATPDRSSSSSSSASSGGGAGSPGGSPLAAPLKVEQAQALADVLFRQQRFKFEPFEWVYEGLAPLLLPPRLARRKLSPLALAAVAAGVGRRVGLPLLPLPAELGAEIAAAVVEGPAGGAAAGGLPLDQLRADVAQRYAGRAGAAAPTASPWVLLLDAGGSGGGSGDGSGGDGSSGDSGGSTPRSSSPAETAAPVRGAKQQQGRQQGQQQGRHQWTHALDACTGELLDAAAAVHKYPGLVLAADWQQVAPLVGWQHMVRTIIQAHQRRGESDLVAHWVYVLLALDPQAAEWEHMLGGSPMGAP